MTIRATFRPVVEPMDLIHLGQVLTFDCPAEVSVRRLLRRPESVGRVVFSRAGDVVGYALGLPGRPRANERLPAAGLWLCRVCVHRRWRGLGCSRALLAGLPDLAAVVPDFDLGCQLWLKALGFTAVQVVRRYFDDGDGYVFRRRLQPAEAMRNEAA